MLSREYDKLRPPNRGIECGDILLLPQMQHTFRYINSNKTTPTLFMMGMSQNNHATGSVSDRHEMDFTACTAYLIHDKLESIADDPPHAVQTVRDTFPAPAA